ncbi:unnamed protein product [Soboliphyme baturini]|uniref:WD_REPEATS_REGION domain-containing protein n=1 Tax=Soboliphyme baturini TaxID=241478 RepID=A0A183IM34_9BILA|nr:unnamed protein product [Soboliphyme baturini]
MSKRANKPANVLRYPKEPNCSERLKRSSGFTSFSTDSDFAYLFVPCTDGTIYQYALCNLRPYPGHPVYILEGHEEETDVVAWNDYFQIFTASNDLTYRLWTILPKDEPSMHRKTSNRVNAIKCSSSVEKDGNADLMSAVQSFEKMIVTPHKDIASSQTGGHQAEFPAKRKLPFTSPFKQTTDGQTTSSRKQLKVFDFPKSPVHHLRNPFNFPTPTFDLPNRVMHQKQLQRTTATSEAASITISQPVCAISTSKLRPSTVQRPVHKLLTTMPASNKPLCKGLLKPKSLLDYFDVL